MSSNRETNWYRKSLKESNQYCLYCGRYIGEGSGIASNREHLIGREFVPTGSLSSEENFNFVFRACVEHNQQKSDYERHVSSITLLQSLDSLSDNSIKEIAIRKAKKDFHPTKKGKKIAESQEEMTIKYSGENFNMSFSLIAPPQPDISYIKYLSFMQMQGLFSLINTPRPYDKEKLMLLSGQYYNFIGAWPKNDWGNNILLYLANFVLDWKCYANINSANGYYKAIVKFNSLMKIWFWALEWNKSYRVTGFICDRKLLKPIMTGLPKEDWKTISQEGNHRIRIKNEKRLEEKDDKLFCGEVE